LFTYVSHTLNHTACARKKIEMDETAAELFGDWISMASAKNSHTICGNTNCSVAHNKMKGFMLCYEKKL
jgi:hypothetical protein